MTTSGGRVRKASIVPSAVSASVTEKPWISRYSRTAARAAGSSSTSRIRRCGMNSLPDRWCGQGRRRRGRKPDADARASFRAIAGNDSTAVLLDDSLHDRQAEPGPADPFADERLKDTADRPRIETRSGVLHAALAPVPSFQLERIAADHDHAAGWRRLHRVLQQILEHLQHLVAVDVDRGEVRRHAVLEA